MSPSYVAFDADTAGASHPGTRWLPVPLPISRPMMAANAAPVYEFRVRRRCAVANVKSSQSPVRADSATAKPWIGQHPFLPSGYRKPLPFRYRPHFWSFTEVGKSIRSPEE